jgi:hypothetical protein
VEQSRRIFAENRGNRGCVELTRDPCKPPIGFMLVFSWRAAGPRYSPGRLRITTLRILVARSMSKPQIAKFPISSGVDCRVFTTMT